MHDWTGDAIGKGELPEKITSTDSHNVGLQCPLNDVKMTRPISIVAKTLSYFSAALPKDRHIKENIKAWKRMRIYFLDLLFSGYLIFILKTSFLYYEKNLRLIQHRGKSGVYGYSYFREIKKSFIYKSSKHKAE